MCVCVCFVEVSVGGERVGTDRQIDESESKNTRQPGGKTQQEKAVRNEQKLHAHTHTHTHTHSQRHTHTDTHTLTHTHSHTLTRTHTHRHTNTHTHTLTEAHTHTERHPYTHTGTHTHSHTHSHTHHSHTQAHTHAHAHVSETGGQSSQVVSTQVCVIPELAQERQLEMMGKTALVIRQFTRGIDCQRQFD